jgi:hypothetical protein
MAIRFFDIGETVICSVKTKRVSVAFNPDAGYPTLQIFLKDSIIGLILAGSPAIPTPIAMTNDAVGEFHYDFQTTGQASGEYRAEVITKVSARYTTQTGAFRID